MPVFRKRADRIRGVAGSLDGDVVLIADGTNGAGPGITRVFAEAGAQVVAAGPHSPTLDVQLRRLSGTPIEATGVVSDAKTDKVRVELVESAKKRIDTLILNPTEYSIDETAGMGPGDLVALATLVGDQMRDRGHAGNIVFITGIDRSGPEASAIAYLEAEMKQLARLLAPNAIRVNAVAPGHVGANRRGNPYSSRVAPLGHASLHPVEVGKVAWFLANDDLSSGMTGTTLKIDRGASLLRPEW